MHSQETHLPCTYLERGNSRLRKICPQQRHGGACVDVANVALAPADVHLADALVAVGVVHSLQVIIG